MGVPKNTKELREHIDEYVRLKLRIEQMENAMASLNKIASLQDGVWLMELSDTVKEHRDEAIVEAGEMYLEIVTAIMHGVKEDEE